MTSYTQFLPYGRQVIDDDDVAAVAAVLRSGRLTTGPAVPAFEDVFRSTVGAAAAVAVSSGTAGLHLAMLALGIGEGDGVVVPTITFLATANAVRFAGAEVVFADVDPNSGLMTPDNFEDALGRAKASGIRITAVISVHLAGQAADMAAIARIGRKRGIRVIEDACHALGTIVESDDGTARKVGACADSDAAVFSCHPVKAITMGEGGVVTANDARLADRLRDLRNHGMIRDRGRFINADMAFDRIGAVNPWYYEMHGIGLNYRASDIHCALGLSQLGKLDSFLETRRRLVARYDASIALLAPLVRPLGRVAGCRPGWHLYIVLIDFDAAGKTRAAVMRRLGDRGIGSQVHFIPVHLQPYYRERYGHHRLPGAEAYYARCLSLPLHAGMEEGDVARVVDTLADQAAPGAVTTPPLLSRGN